MECLSIQFVSDERHVLIAATGKIDDDDLVALHVVGQLHRLRNRMGRFQCGNYSFEPRKSLEGFQGLIICSGNIFDASAVMKMRVFRAD